MFLVKEVTEAILALRRRGFSSYLITNRTEVLLPTHLHQAGHPHPPAGGMGPGPPWPGDLAWLHPVVPLGQLWCGWNDEGGPQEDSFGLSFGKPSWLRIFSRGPEIQCLFYAWLSFSFFFFWNSGTNFETPRIDQKKHVFLSTSCG